jgi:chromosome condensin MukBEF MukE localization factor
MIIKLVCGKEIHVYDLKAQETLDDLVGKIRDLFKKLPEQFVLVYRPVEEEEVRLKTNQELYKLIDSVKNEVKMLKLFIEKSGQSPLAQTKSEQRLETQAIESFDDMTQKIECLE